MRLGEYQQVARTTAIYPKEAKGRYPLLGLIGEIGEFANKYKKVIRDGNEVDKGDQLAELGDIGWYIANFADDIDISLVQVENYVDTIRYNWRKSPSALGDIDHAVFEMAIECGSLTESFVGYHPMGLLGRLQRLCGAFAYLCECCEIPVEDVLRKNIDKLKDRQMRGVLGGSGDKR